MPPESYLDADAALAILGVDRRTLYAYASRGLVRRRNDGARKRYLAEDVRRLAARSAARRGHTAVAASALRWGEPVLDSAISGVVNGRLVYRGHTLEQVVQSGASYEEVAELLWGTTVCNAWPAPFRFRPSGPAPLARMLSLAPKLAASNLGGDRLGRFDVARRIVRTMSLGFGAPRASIAQTVARGLGRPGYQRALEVALIACADHELNASTFVARISAGVRASIGAVVAAALFAVTGSRHGTSPDDIEDFIATLPQRGLLARVERLVESGAPLPGFGHNLYRDGDPRGGVLLEVVRRDRGMRRRAAKVLAFIDAGCALGEAPRVDLGLVALSAGIGAPPRTASGLFALGRTAGWLAHAFEQLDAVDPLRPRARYVGPLPESP